MRLLVYFILSVEWKVVLALTAVLVILWFFFLHGIRFIVVNYQLFAISRETKFGAKMVKDTRSSLINRVMIFPNRNLIRDEELSKELVPVFIISGYGYNLSQILS